LKIGLNNMGEIKMSWKNILKAKKVEKDLNPYDWIKAPIQKWMQEIKGVSGSALGISPKNSTSLHLMVFNHGKARRVGTSGGKVALKGNRVVSGIFQVMNKGSLEKADADKILKWIAYLERMETSPKSNPANVPNTHPAKTIKVKGGKRKKDPENKVVWYGHWNNSHYQKIQTELKKKTLPAIPEDWASPNEDTAKPPLWQAFFSGGERGKSSKNLVTKGLLTILEEYRDHLKKEVKE